MDRVVPEIKTYVLCEVCGELISPSAPAIEAAIGFVESNGFYIDKSIIIHVECADNHILQRIILKLEKD